MGLVLKLLEHIIWLTHFLDLLTLCVIQVTLKNIWGLVLKLLEHIIFTIGNFRYGFI